MEKHDINGSGMCVQYMIAATIDEFRRHYGARALCAFEWRPHVFPRYRAPVVTADGRGRLVRAMHFGLIPFFEKNAKPKKVFHNARSETLAEKVSFKRAFARTRCLVPLESFFEYFPDAAAGKKQLARITPRDGGLLSAAGLWSRWRPPGGGEAVESFTIITTVPPAEIARAGHDRCPLFLKPEAFDGWLDPSDRPPAELSRLLSTGREQLRFELEPLRR